MCSSCFSAVGVKVNPTCSAGIQNRDLLRGRLSYSACLSFSISFFRFLCSGITFCSRPWSELDLHICQFVVIVRAIELILARYCLTEVFDIAKLDIVER